MNILLSQCKLELVRTLRNPFFLVFSVIMPVAFYFIFSNTVGNTQQVDGVAWNAYYLMSMTIFGLVGAAISTFGIGLAQEGSQGWIKQMKVTPLPTWIYYAAKLFTQSIINAVIIIVMFLAGSLLNDVDLATSQWIYSGLWIWIGVLPFLALGMVVGQFKTVDTASIFANISHLGLALLGGLWMPLDAMPKLMQTIGEWMPTNRYGEGAWNIIAGRGLNVTDILLLSSYFIIFAGVAIIISKKRTVQEA
ncbi:ABC transporter permease [Bacillus sp. HMF5848]|uniref:ABC transporter permease n=1 Tax=Bacillus sp. HMF5848 TaxID=2495421 RepID=UPI000F7669DE|nr:ABC transporter permease [Bacillus sp. HMF5848]RSK29060.1 ABC transporter permease [Bacillus sp. HMF5848]